MRPWHWLFAGLALAAGGCPSFGPGFGGEPLPDRDFDGVANELDCAPDDPGYWRIVTAYVDGDWDGHGAGDPVSLCVGATLFGSYSEDATDCDDDRWDAWQLADYFPDADFDGVGAGARVTVCAGNAAPPGYADVTGDCAPEDGTRWQQLGYLHVDADLDGYTVPSAGVVCSGERLPPGYSMTERGPDCDDANPAAFALLDGYRDTDLDGVGTGTAQALCTAGWLPSGWAASAGDCAPDDGGRWQELPYSWVDLDNDGYTVYSAGFLCSGHALPAGYSTSPSSIGDDCDDGAAALHTLRLGYLDADADGYGDAATGQLVCSGAALPAGWLSDGSDCAPSDPQRWRLYAYTFRDADGDKATVPETGSICVGTTVPAGYGTTSSYPSDCNDADPAVFYPMSGYADADLDGFGAPPLVSVCTAGTLPAGYSSNSTDCAPADPSLWRPFASANVDRDGDGYTVREAGPFCFGAVLPAPYIETPVGNDCDDADPTLWRWVVLYEDKDGDGVGAPPRWVPCLGSPLPSGWSTRGYDPDDSNAAVSGDGALDLLLTVID